MAQMWQYYDRAICDAIKESVEPIMDQYKPPGIVKKIYFKRMTFGDLPMTIDDVWVENEGEKHILLEVHRLSCCSCPGVPYVRLCWVCSPAITCIVD